ncbi:MAG: site-specific DNA-methyltransferase [Calditrichaeota bacterium]|nr:MAG: site-specific DNA-methyltransferase [Calditrichota bacterium]
MKIKSYLQKFTSLETQAKTQVFEIKIEGQKIQIFVNEFWTAKQRQASSIHEISYRACFKPQLPRFFIEVLTKENDIVYDPFGGRGTTAIESGILNRKVISNDVNPLSRILTEPRFFIPTLEEVEKRLSEINFDKKLKAEIDLSMFYDSKTESEIASLKNHCKNSKNEIDKWIKMVATNRLTGHSKGFFSVYTLPPNQAVSPERQIKINKKLNQKPEYKNTQQIILKKTKTLINRLSESEKSNLGKAGLTVKFLNKDASLTKEIPPNSVQLTITSPPFLNIVQYSTDNWLRCWFNGIDENEIAKKITMSRTVEDWTEKMSKVFQELFRVTKKDGWVAFEVGEVRKGKINLDETVVSIGLRAGFKCIGILINSQKFTKTANIWGIKNNSFGTNSNRIVIFRKV